MSPGTLVAAFGVLLLNVPFGYWRAGLRTLSPLWFVAIHAPIPLAIGLRVSHGFRATVSRGTRITRTDTDLHGNGWGGRAFGGGLALS